MRRTHLHHRAIRRIDIGRRADHAATTSEALWVAHLDDLAPDGLSRPLTQGALLGSHRALDPDRTWYLADGTVPRWFPAN
jgi:uncharacterized protein